MHKHLAPACVQIHVQSSGYNQAYKNMSGGFSLQCSEYIPTTENMLVLEGLKKKKELLCGISCLDLEDMSTYKDKHI